MRKWFFLQDTGIVNQKFRRKIIRSINDKIILPDQFPDIGCIHEHPISFNLYIRIHGVHSLFR